MVTPCRTWSCSGGTRPSWASRTPSCLKYVDPQFLFPSLRQPAPASSILISWWICSVLSLLRRTTSSLSSATRPTTAWKSWPPASTSVCPSRSVYSATLATSFSRPTCPPFSSSCSSLHYLPFFLLFLIFYLFRLSWVSFWINHEATSARVALGTYISHPSRIFSSIEGGQPIEAHLRPPFVYIVFQAIFRSIRECI